MSAELAPGPYSEMPATDPPAGPTARALRAIGRNLDELGELATRQAAAQATLTELQLADGHKLDRVVAQGDRIEAKIDQIIQALGPLVDRVRDLEQWRGEHERDHTRQ